MDIPHFIQNYREAFGACAPLPLLFYYSHTPLAETEKIEGCFFKSLSRVREGKPVSLNAEVIGCGGGKFYTGFSPISPYIPDFVSTKERYKQTPDMVTDYIEQLDVKQTDKKYLNFVRIDEAESFDPMEGLLFFATPDILSGLCSWAFFDTNAPDAVTTLFGSGCSAVVTTAVRENRKNGHRTFLGLFDPSVRPYVGENELSFVIPRCRFQTMYETMQQSCLFGTRAWAKVRDRIPCTLPHPFHIRCLDRSEYPQAIALSLDVFITCGKADFNEDGLETFKSFVYNEQLMSELTLYGAFEEKELVGILGTKNEGKHISLFFIKPDRQKKGIGKALFQYMTQICKVAEITVSSSTYAVPFYSALGFAPLGEPQCFHGLTSVPMKRIKFYP